MPNFTYKAIDSSGSVVRGKIEAETEASAFDKIKAKRLAPFKLRLTTNRTFSYSFSKPIKHKDLSRYIRQFSTLLGAGVPLLEALDSMSKSNAHIALSKASYEIRKELRAGERFSNAMEKHIPLLPKYVPRLAELGEATGQSAKALADAAERMDFEDTIRGEIRTALSYPVFLASVGTIIVFLMFLFVVPRFAALIGSNGNSLPVISRFTINLGTYMSQHKALVFAGVSIFAGSVIFVQRNPKMKGKARRYLERLPMIGTVLIKGELGRWARTVGIALDNGADLLTALRLGESGVNSEKLREAFVAVRGEVRAGRNIDDALKDNTAVFDPLSIDLIRTGRASGKLADMLLFIGKTQENETRETAKRLAAVAEPTAILLISLIVGTIVISIVLAMTSLYDFAI